MKIPPISVLLLATAISASASNSLMIKFSSAAGNDMSAAQATALGVEAYQNVRTGTTGNGSTAAISLDSVTGGVSYADYYQQFQLANLGQPYSTLVGAKLITTGTGTGANLSASIALDLSAWKTANAFTKYKVTVYYAGRSAAAEALMTDGTPDVFFDDGTITPNDTMTVALHGAPANTAYFGGIGALHEFTGNNLTIQMKYLGGVSIDYQAGISAIKIEGVVPILLWTGATSGEWSSATLSSPKNWVLTGDGVTQSDYENNSIVTFNATATTKAIDINAGDVSPKAITFDQGSSDYSISGSNGITGTSTLTKSGSGTLTISNANTRTGATTVSAGNLTVANEFALAGSTVSGSFSGGGIIDFSGITAARFSALGGDSDIALENELTQPVTLTLGSSNASASYAGILSGAGSVVKSGTGSQSFNYPSTFTGGASITAGPAHNTASGTSAAIQAGITNALGTGPITYSTTTDTSILRFTGSSVELPNPVTLSSTPGIISEITVNQASTGTLSGKLSGGNATSTLYLDSSASNASSVLQLTNPANDFLVSYITMWRGGLAITSDAVLGNPNNDIQHFTESTNGALRFDADNITLNANRSIQFYTTTGPAPFNTQAFTATIAGDFSGVGNLTKQGSGKLILTGTNNATGASTIAEGTLQIDGTFASGGGTVTANANGTLAGNGTITRDVTIEGTVSPGASVGTLSITGTTIINGTLASEIDGATTDLLAVTGNLTLGAASVLNVTEINPGTAFPYVIATYTGTRSGTFASVSPGYSVNYGSGVIELVESSTTDFASWAATTGVSGFNTDSDNDGIANGIEFVIGGVPAPGAGSDSSSLLPKVSYDSNTDELVFVFRRMPDSAYLNPGAEYDIDMSGVWTAAPAGTVIGTEGEADLVEVRLPSSLAAGGKLFVRLAVSLPVE